MVWIHIRLRILGLLPLIILFYFSGELLRGATQLAWVQEPDQRNAKFDSLWTSFFSVGHQTSFADLLWIHALQDEALSHVQDGQHAVSWYDLDLLTDVDPAFFEAYGHGSSILSVVRNDSQGALNLLNKADVYIQTKLGTESPVLVQNYWSNAWWIYLMLGYVNIYDFDRLDEASNALLKTEKIAGAPPYLAQLGRHLETVDGRYEVAHKLLVFLIQTSKDETLKNKYQEKQEELSLTYALYQADQKWQKYRTKKSAQLSSFLSELESVSFFENSEIKINPEGHLTIDRQQRRSFGIYKF
jgi:hypothetical protein